jgi:hypothetical protein
MPILYLKYFLNVAIIETFPAIIVSFVEVEKLGVKTSVNSVPILSDIFLQNSSIKSSLYL